MRIHPPPVVLDPMVATKNAGTGGIVFFFWAVEKNGIEARNI